MERILRSMLFVPASSWRMITGAVTEGADAVILDLEDSCPLGEKETGRIFARDAMPMLKDANIDVFVRVNSLDTGLTQEDLNYIVVEELDGIVLPKTDSADDVNTLDQLMQEEERKKGLVLGNIAVMPLLETPKGVLAVSEIILASPRVIGVTFGAGDYSREIGAGMGVTRMTPEENFLMTNHPRCCVALAAMATDILAIDTPYFGLVIDTEGLIEETQKTKLLGFTGRMLTHPRHVRPVNRVFAPAKEDVEFAKQVKVVYEETQARGLGATTIGGRMIDYGSYRRAANLLATAERIAQKEQGRTQKGLIS